MKIGKAKSFVLFSLSIMLLTSCTRKHRITKRQREIKQQIETHREASMQLLMSEDLVDSMRYQKDSGYRSAIMKQAQGWIITSDSLLQDAEKLQTQYDSLETELFLLEN